MEPLGQGRFQVSLEELAVPTIAALEQPVNPLMIIRVGHEVIVGEYRTRTSRRTERPDLAERHDLAMVAMVFDLKLRYWKVQW